MPLRPLKVFLCHAHADRDPVPQGDDMRGLYTRLTQDGVDAWLDKAKLPQISIENWRSARPNKNALLRGVLLYLLLLFFLKLFYLLI